MGRAVAGVGGFGAGLYLGDAQGGEVGAGEVADRVARDERVNGLGDKILGVEPLVAAVAVVVPGDDAAGGDQLEGEVAVVEDGGEGVVAVDEDEIVAGLGAEAGGVGGEAGDPQLDAVAQGRLGGSDELTGGGADVVGGEPGGGAGEGEIEGGAAVVAADLEDAAGVDRAGERGEGGEIVGGGVDGRRGEQADGDIGRRRAEKFVQRDGRQAEAAGGAEGPEGAGDGVLDEAAFEAEVELKFFEARAHDGFARGAELVSQSGR